ncbi:MAG: DUF1028 domain-containing protein [Pseudomonadota bacterium]
MASSKRVLALVALLSCTEAHATFSISACDDSGACGVAVATNNLAVGATVAYARADVGALATQFETNPNYGPRGLSMLARGMTPERTVATLLEGDNLFEGQGPSARQVAIVSRHGDTVIFTGAEALGSPWAGGRRGRGYAVIGNGLAGAQVLADMETTFLHAEGPLAARLMAALEAGHRAGGQSIGEMSAVLLVRTRSGAFQDTDLRVDAADDPVAELRKLFDLTRAHDAMLGAERFTREKRQKESDEAMETALRLAPSWDRIWRRATRLALQWDEPRACNYLRRFRELNARWADQEIAAGSYERCKNGLSGRVRRGAGQARPARPGCAAADPIVVPIHEGLAKVCRWRIPG